MVARTTPFDIVFGVNAGERFPRLRTSLNASGVDAFDEDAFVLDREVITLLREEVPDDGVGPAVTQYLAFLHHAFLYWLEGEWCFRLTRERATRLLAETSRDEVAAAGAPRAFYAQFPERMLWAELAPGEPHEPLDGLFVRPWGKEGFFVLGVFGLHPGREGFTVAEAEGYRTPDLARADGSPIFAPVLSGGSAAGLYSLVGEEEILELAASATAVAASARTTEQRPEGSPVEVR